jgi:hypothetical protein
MKSVKAAIVSSDNSEVVRSDDKHDDQNLFVCSLGSGDY